MAVAKNAAKLLGLQTAEQLGNCFASNSCLPGDQFKMFWTAVEADPKESTTYMFEILKKLLSVLEENNSQNAPLLESLVNSTHFAMVYMPFSAADGRISRFLKKWQSEEGDKNFTKNCPPAKDVMRVLGMSQEKQDLVGPNMIAASTLHSAEEFTVLSDVSKYPSLDDSPIRGASVCFHYHHLKLMAAEEEKRVAILSNILGKLQTLPQQMRMKPMLAKTSLLALLFLLKQFLALNSLADREFLKKVISVVQQFYLWPQPYGSVARSVLGTVHRELMLPGATLVEAVAAESFTAESSHVHLVERVRSKALYYLCDSDSVHAQQFARVLDLKQPSALEKQRRASYGQNKQAKKTLPAQISPSAMALIMLKLLADDAQGGAVELGMMAKLTEPQVSALYAHVEALMRDLALLTNPDQAAEHRSRALAKLKAELEKASSAGGATGKLVVLPAEVEPPFLPRLPALWHVVHDAKVAYQFDTKEVLKMMCLEYTTYPNTGLFDELDSILSGCSAAPKPLELRLLLAGDDALTHSFLCAYMRMLQTNPQWVLGISLKLYLLPWGKNHLAAWIARHDGWYHRHVYAPFRSPLFLVPWAAPPTSPTPGEGLGDGSGSKEEDTSRAGGFFRDTVAMYVREACASVELFVYQLEGWLEEAKGLGQNEKDKKLEALPDHKIPFCQRLEIGQLAEAEAYRHKRGLSPDLPLEELLARKDFSFQAPDLDFSFTQVDLAGRPLRHLQEEGMGFNSILVSSVPRMGEACFPGNPTVPWLEMAVSAQAPKTGKRSVLLTEPRQHVSGLDITCNNPAAKFSVFLDGRVFGPFHHIKVSLATRPNPEAALALAAGASTAPAQPTASPSTGSSPPTAAAAPANGSSPASPQASDAEQPFKFCFQTFFPIDL